MNKLGVNAKCLKCGIATKGRWICDNCVGVAVDAMPPKDLLRAAKLGITAVIDEATGYQQVRAKNELYQLYFKYLADS